MQSIHTLDIFCILQEEFHLPSLPEKLLQTLQEEKLHLSNRFLFCNGRPVIGCLSVGESEWIEEGIQRILDDNTISAVVPVYQEQDHHPYRAKRVNEDGRVGIGTSTPGARLMVVGEDDLATTPALNITNNSLNNLFKLRSNPIRMIQCASFI